MLKKGILIALFEIYWNKLSILFIDLFIEIC